MSLRVRLLLACVLVMFQIPIHGAPPPAHDQFRIAVYIPVFVVERMREPAFLENSWKQLSTQVAVDKVYIETYRSGTIAEDAVLEAVKTFFITRGVQVAGGIAY